MRWEPGQRLAWASSIDDVETEVSFEASGAGTVVTGTARVQVGGHDRGGTSWVRVVPKWCARREHAPRAVQDLARLALGISLPADPAGNHWTFAQARPTM